MVSASPAVREGIRAIPDDRLLVETDSPYFPVGVPQGTQMSPVHIGIVYRHVAMIRGVPLPELCALVLQNFRDMFGSVIQFPGMYRGHL